MWVLPKRAWRASLVATVLVSAMIAQERVTTAGRVLGAEGKPAANATVHFVGSVPPLLDRLEPADAVTATTNDKGRFQVALLDRADYECWAAGPATGDGVHPCSDVVFVQPGTGFEISLVATTVPRSLTVTGFDAWRDHGELRLEVALALSHCHATALAVKGEPAELPLAPAGVGWHLFVRRADGGLCWLERIEPGAEAAAFSMPPPHTIPVHVVDDVGRPIAEATIRCLSPSGHRPPRKTMTAPPPLDEWPIVGRTDSSGTARVVVPCRTDPWQDERAHGPLLLVGKRDHAGVVGGWHSQRIGDAEQAGRDGAEPKLSFTLRKQASFGGGLLRQDGKPMANVAIALSGSCTMPLAQGRLHAPTVFTTRTAADGTFCFEGLPTIQGPVLYAPRADVRTLAPALHVTDLTRPFVVDYRTLATVDLAVQDVDGGPALGANVVLLPSPVGNRQLGVSTWRGRLDNRGTARLNVQPGSWSILVSDRRGFVCSTSILEGQNTLALTLTAMPVLRGVVRLGQDEHASGVSMFVNSISSSSKPTDQVATLRAVGTALNNWFANCTVVRTDGSFELPFLDVPGTTYSGCIMVGKRLANMRLETSAEPIEYMLRDR